MSEVSLDDERRPATAGTGVGPSSLDGSAPGSTISLLAWAMLSCLILVGLCIAFIDRSAATFSHAEFGGRTQVFVDLTHIVDPLLPLAALGLLGSAIAACLGWRLRGAWRILLACALAVAIAYLFREEFKYAFGRLWPETWVQNNPSWIKDGAYGFFPFHGGTGWSSFPSGHMTMIAAPAGALWAALPRWRVVVAIPVLAVAVGLYGADYHFVGDMVAGTYLGSACGVGSWALLRGAAPLGRASTPR